MRKTDFPKSRLKEIAEELFPYGYSVSPEDYDEYIGLIKNPVGAMQAILGINNFCDEEYGVISICCYYWGDEELIEPFGYVVGIMRFLAPDLEPIGDCLEVKNMNVLEFKISDGSEL